MLVGTQNEKAVYKTLSSTLKTKKRKPQALMQRAFLEGNTGIKFANL